MKETDRVHNPTGRTPMLTEMLIKVLLEFYLVQKKDSNQTLNGNLEKKYKKRAKQWVSDCITSLIQPRGDSCIACLDALLIKSGAMVQTSGMNKVSPRNVMNPNNWFKQELLNEGEMSNPYLNQIQSFLQESSLDDRSLEALIN